MSIVPPARSTLVGADDSIITVCLWQTPGTQESQLVCGLAEKIPNDTKRREIFNVSEPKRKISGCSSLSVFVPLLDVLALVMFAQMELLSDVVQFLLCGVFDDLDLLLDDVERFR